MTTSLNEVRLIGNVGKDPDIRMTQDGKEVASFSLATSEIWTDKITGEKKEKTEWHKIVIFAARLIPVIKSYIKKGTRLYICGSLHTRKWVDQSSSSEKYVTEIVLQSGDSKLMILSTKDDNENMTSIQSKVDEDDDIPF